MWIWHRLVEIITRHDWQLTALFLSILGLAHGAAIFFTPGAWPAWWGVLAPPALTFLAAALFCWVMLGRGKAARYTLVVIACVLGWQAYYLLFNDLHIAGFLVAGAASLGAGMASIAAE